LFTNAHLSYSKLIDEHVLKIQDLFTNYNEYNALINKKDDKDIKQIDELRNKGFMEIKIEN
jgi:hypothetical protein